MGRRTFVCDLGYTPGMPMVTPPPTTPDCEPHEPRPEGYGAHSEWADAMAETHTQRQCRGCGLWRIWEPKETAAGSHPKLAGHATRRPGRMSRMEQLSKKLMNWASILEPNTREQAERTASMPFIYPHVALMPDAHLGKGCSVGTVVPTLGAIMPAGARRRSLARRH